MRWVDPSVGLGWVGLGRIGSVRRWVGLDRVTQNGPVDNSDFDRVAIASLGVTSRDDDVIRRDVTERGDRARRRRWQRRRRRPSKGRRSLPPGLPVLGR